MSNSLPKKKRNRRECPNYQELDFDYSCGASEAFCKLNPKRKEHSLYCIHEGNNQPCPLDEPQKEIKVICRHCMEGSE